MLNQILGSLTLLGAGLCLFFALKFYKRNEYKKALYLIVILGLILRLFVASDLFLHEWDEKYHALVAKNLISHPFVPTLYDKPVLNYDYKDWCANHIWLHKPPASLWLLAFSTKLFGINEIALRLPSIILSTIVIFFIFFIGKSVFNEKVGILACFFWAINGFLIALAGGKIAADHVDTIFIFFITFGIFLSFYYLNKRSVIILLSVGAVTGLAVLTKWLTGLLIIPIFFILLLDKDKFRNAVLKSLVACVVALIIFLPWQLYIHKAFPQEAAWEDSYNNRHIFEAVDGHSGTVFFHLVRMPRYFGELIFIPLIFFFYMLKKRKSDLKMLAVSVWLILPYLFFSLVVTKGATYIMISSPAVFLILAYFCWYLIDNLNLFKHKKLIIALIILLILLPIRYSLERIKPFKNYDKNPVRVKELRALNNRIEDKNSVLFNVKQPIEAMFYTPFTAYSFMPTQRQIRHVHEKGYKVVILKGDSRLPDYIKNDKSVIILTTPHR
jgi:4-amino-4-deoxy-L-arabinose transferase